MKGLFTMKPRTAMRPLAAATIAAAALAGCGSSSHHHSSTTQSVTTSGSQTTSASTVKPPAVVSDPNIPTVVHQNLAARKDVTATVCKPAPGGYEARGTIKNTLGKAARFKITTVFTSAQATGVGYGTTSVQVPPGATRPWTVTAKFKRPPRVICVLRGVDT